MESLAYIVEPTELLLTWQPSDESAPNRTRRTVGRITRCPDGGASFLYLTDTEDYQAAKSAGFQGYPAFRLDAGEIKGQGVIDALLRRLPPRTRKDFDRFLAQHRLPAPFAFSDFALLGYTGARLPSDGFGLVPVFPRNLDAPCDLIVEIAGVRYVFRGNPADLSVGDPVSFHVEDGNPVDVDAVLVDWRGQRIGYVNRAMRDTFVHWLSARSISAAIERVAGTPERPLVYVRVSVR